MWGSGRSIPSIHRVWVSHAIGRGWLWVTWLNPKLELVDATKGNTRLQSRTLQHQSDFVIFLDVSICLQGFNHGKTTTYQCLRRMKREQGYRKSSKTKFIKRHNWDKGLTMTRLQSWYEAFQNPTSLCSINVWVGNYLSVLVLGKTRNYVSPLLSQRETLYKQRQCPRVLSGEQRRQK